MLARIGLIVLLMVAGCGKASADPATIVSMTPQLYSECVGRRVVDWQYEMRVRQMNPDTALKFVWDRCGCERLGTEWKVAMSDGRVYSVIVIGGKPRAPKLLYRLPAITDSL